MIARVSDASLPLDEAVRLHLFRVVAKVEDLVVETCLAQDLLYLRGVRFGAATEHPHNISIILHERRERLDVPVEVHLVQRRLAVGEAVPFEGGTQPRIFWIVGFGTPVADKPPPRRSLAVTALLFQLFQHVHLSTAQECIVCTEYWRAPAQKRYTHELVLFSWSGYPRCPSMVVGPQIRSFSSPGPGLDLFEVVLRFDVDPTRFPALPHMEAGLFQP